METLKEQWVAALRSGEYKQGTGVLYNPIDDTYCCLGVLAKICSMPLTTEWKDQIEFIPAPITKILEYVEENIVTRASGDLAVMNDSGLSTFNNIADYIETNITVEEYHG